MTHGNAIKIKMWNKICDSLNLPFPNETLQLMEVCAYLDSRRMTLDALEILVLSFVLALVDHLAILGH